MKDVLCYARYSCRIECSVAVNCFYCPQSVLNDIENVPNKLLNEKKMKSKFALLNQFFYYKIKYSYHIMDTDGKKSNNRNKSFRG